MVSDTASSAKASHVVCLSVRQWDSTHGSLSYEHQRDKQRTWPDKEKTIRNTFGINMYFFIRSTINIVIKKISLKS